MLDPLHNEGGQSTQKRGGGHEKWLGGEAGGKQMQKHDDVLGVLKAQCRQHHSAHTFTGRGV